MGGRLARKGRPLGKARTRSLALMPMTVRPRERANGPLFTRVHDLDRGPQACW